MVERKNISNNLRREIYERDGWICQWGIKCTPTHKSEKRLSIHHIDLNPKNNNKNNLISLCEGCHKHFHLSLIAIPTTCQLCGKEFSRYGKLNNRLFCRLCYAKITLKRSNQWNKNYAHCKMCKTKSIPYQAKGYCKKCYGKYLYKISNKRREDIKKVNQNWRIKNPDKWKIINDKARKKYLQKKKVIHH